MSDRLLPWLLSTHTLLSALGLLIYTLMSHVLRQRRHPSAAVGWVLLLLSAPYVGIPLYLMFGSRKLPRARRPALAPAAMGRDTATPPPSTSAELQTDRSSGAGRSSRGARVASDSSAALAAAWLHPLAASMGLPRPARYRALVLHRDGADASQALWEIIDAARQTLDVCTFLLGRDVLGDAVAERLARRARDGVRVRLLVDGVGLLMGGRSDLDGLAARGVQVARFVPPLQSPLKGRLNLRNHRKMAIADRSRLWCGGRNLAASYFEAGPGHARVPWLDLSFDLQGPVVDQAAALFEADWRFATQAARIPMPLPADHAPSVPVDRADLRDATPLDAAQAQLVPSGPDYVEDTLHALLVTACFRAQRRILAVTPYLVPDESLLSALQLAARRGVEIDIVLPAVSNHRLADFARRRAMRELHGAGARLRLVPRMVHAKAIVFDDGLALAGSANLDARSLFLNYELMLAFDAPVDVERFARAIEAIAADARVWQPAVADPGLLRRLAEGLVLWLAFQL